MDNPFLITRIQTLKCKSTALKGKIMIKMKGIYHVIKSLKEVPLKNINISRENGIYIFQH